MSESLGVTGGLGFIGSAFIRRALARGTGVVNVDSETYAADRRRIAGVPDNLLATHNLDVGDEGFAELIAKERPAAIVHFAAETHVTRSETNPEAFFRSNLDGTRNVLEAARKHGVPLVVHVSTDEVYGPALDHPFREDDKEAGEGRATSPYARSKALADDLACSFMSHLPVIVVRPTNCFGPWQHPEKAVPRWATRALKGDKLPVWGDGAYVRDWMFVDDVCAAIELVIDKGIPGEVYNIGPQGDVRTNLQIATLIARAAGYSDDLVYLTAYDRPHHDRRYSVDASRLRALGWRSTSDLGARLTETVAWYSKHREWWEPLAVEAEKLYADAETRTTT